MKYLLLLLIISLISCASLKQENIRNKNIQAYQVYKIDSINGYYLIYAKRKDTLYKIVSPKIGNRRYKKIQVNKKYDFDLYSALSNRHVGRKEILPQNSLLVNCFSFDDSTQICLEGDSIRDLYFAKNIKGLYFIK